MAYGLSSPTIILKISLDKPWFWIYINIDDFRESSYGYLPYVHHELDAEGTSLILIIR
jgi:hypothetical protein